MSIRARHCHFTNWAKVRAGLIASAKAANISISITSESSDSDVRSFLINSSSTANPLYYYVCYIGATQEIYTHGRFYNCATFDDSDIQNSIGELGNNLNAKADLSYVQNIEKDIADNEFVVAKTLTDLENNKANRSEIPDINDFATKSDLNLVDAKFSGYLPLSGGELTGDLSIAGEATATDFTTTSDNRLKDFTKDVDVDFGALKNIPKKYYYWKDKSMGTDLQIGTSAQELMKVYPECVSYNEDQDRYSVNYQKLSIVALAAIDKLNDRISELENKLNDKNN